MYRVMSDDRRPCVDCLARIFGNRSSDDMKIPVQIKEFADQLEDYLPPHFIEEVRGQMLDILQ